MRVITRKERIYTFDELSPQAQETAIQAERKRLLEEDTPEYFFTITDEEAINWEEKTGVPIDKYDIVYSLNNAKDSGLSFTTRLDEEIDIEQLLNYYATLGARKRERVADIKKQHDYWFILNYYTFIISRDDDEHVGKNTVSCEYWNCAHNNRGKEIAEEISQIINEIKDTICQDMYGRLQAAQEYMTDPDTIAEKLEINGYEFTEDGTMI